MKSINYRDLSVLVADDVSHFRSTINGMLLALGVEDIDMASSGEEAIEKCAKKNYNVVLCDYDLGPGRNGQHVLEEVRYRRIIGALSVFIIVSAEASRHVVMSAYDCEPDDYLMKPITGLMLQRRMQRLLTKKECLRPVYRALASDDMDQAIDLLVDMSLSEERHFTAAQKMLGELFIRQGELQKAQKLYARALDVYQLEWARLGLAYVKHLQGDLVTAGTWLDQIVEHNPMYLPAYDVLADNWSLRGDKTKMQRILARAVEISPMSILRQKRLAKIANDNQDPFTALEALRTTVKLGHKSCYGSVHDSFEFGRTVSNAIEKNLPLPDGAVEEALTVLNTSKDAFNLAPEEAAQLDFLCGRINANTGDVDLARKSMMHAQNAIASGYLGIDAEVDQVALLLSLDEHDQAESLLRSLQEKYADDQLALEKLDKFLTEPVSDLSRDLVTNINREGIDLYSVGEFDQAITCFDKARILFPKHVGIQLNIVQALVGKMKEGDKTMDVDKVHAECHAGLTLVDSLIDKDHEQYERFIRLKHRANAFLKRGV